MYQQRNRTEPNIFITLAFIIVGLVIGLWVQWMFYYDSCCPIDNLKWVLESSFTYLGPYLLFLSVFLMVAFSWAFHKTPSKGANHLSQGADPTGADLSGANRSNVVITMTFAFVGIVIGTFLESSYYYRCCPALLIEEVYYYFTDGGGYFLFLFGCPMAALSLKFRKS